MANISSLLEIIRTAHLGRDMRQALHDSIQAVNNDTETALGKSLTFTNATRKLSLKANDGTVLSEATIPGGGSGGGSVDSVNGVAPDENGNVQLTATDVGAMSSSAALNDISDVTLSSPSNGQVLGYDGSKWKNVNAPSGGGGHTIKNESGTALTQRDNLQFKGCSVSDDSTNNATVVSVQTSNRNLLDNAWFTVNQKGLTSGDFNNNRIDRWKTSYASSPNGNWNLTNGILTLNNTVTGNEYWTQVIENASELVGKQVTVSILFSNGNIGTNTFQFGAVSYQTTYSDDNCSVIISSSSSLMLTIKGGKSISIKALKLELGSASTLAFDSAPDYTTELLKCQRYFYRIKNSSGSASFVGIGLAQTTTDITTILDLPCPMRATPTCSYSGTIKISDSTDHTVSAISIAQSNIDGKATVSFTTSSLTSGKAYFINLYSGYIDFDAQL